MLTRRASGSSESDPYSFPETRGSLNRLGLFYVISTTKLGQKNDLRRITNDMPVVIIFGGSAKEIWFLTCRS